MLSEIKNFNWTKNWEGRFSLLFALLGLKMSSFKEILRVDLSHALLFYKDGVCSCYFADEEMNTFGANLVEIIKNNPEKLDGWINITRSDIDDVRKLMKTQVDDKSFQAITELLQRYGVYLFILKELGNYLPENMRSTIFTKIEEIRKYGETVYFDTSEYISGILNRVSSESNIKVSLLECLTPRELATYFSEKTLPDQAELEIRNKNLAIFFNPNSTFLNDDENKEVQDFLFQNLDVNELRGQPSFPGIVKGKCKLVTKFTSDVDMEEGSILVTGMTDPRFVPLMKKAGAIVTDAGGVLCHAAIVSRELRIPCVVGTKIATKVLKDGDMVEVDAEKGIVTTLK